METLVRRLIKLTQEQGHIKGPAISDCTGKLTTMGELDDILLSTLEVIFEQEPQLPHHIFYKIQM